MRDSVLNEITDIVQEAAKKIAGNSSYIYLNSEEGQWRDAENHVHYIRNMETQYLKNCLRELKNGGGMIYLKFSNVKNNCDLSGHRFSIEDKSKIVNIAKEEIANLVDLKTKEIKAELAKR